MNAAVFTDWRPDPCAVMLGTGYMIFESRSGIHGLAKELPERIDLLAVQAEHPGRGQFRHFIHALKLNYRTICVWEIMNEQMNPILKRYGFSPVQETDCGETLTGWKWEKHDASPSPLQ